MLHHENEDTEEGLPTAANEEDILELIQRIQRGELRRTEMLDKLLQLKDEVAAADSDLISVMIKKYSASSLDVEDLSGYVLSILEKSAKMYRKRDDSSFALPNQTFEPNRASTPYKSERDNPESPGIGLRFDTGVFSNSDESSASGHKSKDREPLNMSRHDGNICREPPRFLFSISPSPKTERNTFGSNWSKESQLGVSKEASSRTHNVQDQHYLTVPPFTPARPRIHQKRAPSVTALGRKLKLDIDPSLSSAHPNYFKNMTIEEPLPRKRASKELHMNLGKGYDFSTEDRRGSPTEPSSDIFRELRKRRKSFPQSRDEALMSAVAGGFIDPNRKYGTFHRREINRCVEFIQKLRGEIERLEVEEGEALAELERLKFDSERFSPGVDPILRQYMPDVYAGEEDDVGVTRGKTDFLNVHFVEPQKSSEKDEDERESCGCPPDIKCNNKFWWLEPILILMLAVVVHFMRLPVFDFIYT